MTQMVSVFNIEAIKYTACKTIKQQSMTIRVYDTRNQKRQYARMYDNNNKLKTTVKQKDQVRILNRWNFAN